MLLKWYPWHGTVLWRCLAVFTGPCYALHWHAIVIHAISQASIWKFGPWSSCCLTLRTFISQAPSLMICTLAWPARTPVLLAIARSQTCHLTGNHLGAEQCETQGQTRSWPGWASDAIFLVPMSKPTLHQQMCSILYLLADIICEEMSCTSCSVRCMSQARSAAALQLWS